MSAQVGNWMFQPLHQAERGVGCADPPARKSALAAGTFPIVAKYIGATQLKLDWDGVNNAACEDGVECNPADPLSYVLDVSTGEQRDVLHFYDMGYNVGIIDWSIPLEVGHTYKVQMHGSGDYYRISQEFLYEPSTPTNVADGQALVQQLVVSSTTNPILSTFVPALPAIDNNCLLSGVYDLSVDVYVNGTLRQTITRELYVRTSRSGRIEFLHQQSIWKWQLQLRGALGLNWQHVEIE